MVPWHDSDIEVVDPAIQGSFLLKRVPETLISFFGDLMVRGRRL